MSIFDKLPSFLPLRSWDRRFARSTEYHDWEMLKLDKEQDVIDYVLDNIRAAGWAVKEKPDQKVAFYQRFSTTMYGVLWLKNGFFKESKNYQAILLAHEWTHFKQWTAPADPNEFLVDYIIPRCGWAYETQAGRVGCAMAYRLGNTDLEKLYKAAEARAKSYYKGYPNIHLLRYRAIKRYTPPIIMMGVDDARSATPSS